MTIIVRRDNHISTDSLYVEDGPQLISVSYGPKIFVNTQRTCVIAISGTNLIGDITKIIDNFSNDVHLAHSNGDTSGVLDIPSELIELYQTGDSKSIVFCTKYASTCITTAEYKSEPPYKILDHYPESIVVLGSGALAASYIPLDQLSTVEIVEVCRQRVASCGGNIQTFNLNNLLD